MTSRCSSFLQTTISWFCETGFPMTTNCDPLLADIYLCLYEAELIQSLNGKETVGISVQFHIQVHRWYSINNPEFENMRSKARQRATLLCRWGVLLLTWIYSCRSWMTVNITLPYVTHVRISISIKQIFRSWVAIFPFMASLSRSIYDMPGLAPGMDVLFWGPRDFPISFFRRDTLGNAWYRNWGSSMVDTGILSNTTKFSFHEC